MGGKKGTEPPTVKEIDEQAAEQQQAFADAAFAAAGGHRPPPGQRTASSSPRSWRSGRTARLSARPATQPPHPSTDHDGAPDGAGAAADSSPGGSLGTLSPRTLSGAKQEWLVETYLTPAPPPRARGSASPRGADAMPPLWCAQRVSDVLGRGGVFDTFGFAVASRHLRGR